MMDFARPRFVSRASSYRKCQDGLHVQRIECLLTCSSLQQTFPSSHLSPQRATSLCLTELDGSSASPLSGHGKSEPKKPCLPQFPRIAHRPASCFSVKLDSAWTNDVKAAEALSSQPQLLRIASSQACRWLPTSSGSSQCMSGNRRSTVASS